MPTSGKVCATDTLIGSRINSPKCISRTFCREQQALKMGSPFHRVALGVSRLPWRPGSAWALLVCLALALSTPQNTQTWVIRKIYQH